jgi:putative endonuclease
MLSDREKSPESMTTAEFGRYGEELAARTLARAGWRLVARNVRERGGEIDLVVSRRGILRFVEVKAALVRDLEDADAYAPESRVGPKKLASMERAALCYLARRPDAPEFHIDVASVRVERGTGRTSVDLIEDVL